MKALNDPGFLRTGILILVICGFAFLALALILFFAWNIRGTIRMWLYHHGYLKIQVNDSSDDSDISEALSDEARQQLDDLLSRENVHSQTGAVGQAKPHDTAAARQRFQKKQEAAVSDDGSAETSLLQPLQPMQSGRFGSVNSEPHPPEGKRTDDGAEETALLQPDAGEEQISLLPSNGTSNTEADDGADATALLDDTGADATALLDEPEEVPVDPGAEETSLLTPQNEARQEKAQAENPPAKESDVPAFPPEFTIYEERCIIHTDEQLGANVPV